MGPLTSSGEMEEVCLVANNRFDSITIPLPENKVKVPHSVSALNFDTGEYENRPSPKIQVIKLRVSLHR